MTKQIPDFYYTQNDFWIHLAPNNDSAVNAYNEFARQNNGRAEILVIHKKQAFHALKKAGYSIRKTPKMTKKEKTAFWKDVNDFFDELEKDNKLS